MGKKSWQRGLGFHFDVSENLKKNWGNYFLKIDEEDRWKFWYNASICCFRIGFCFDVSEKLGKEIWGNLSTICYGIFNFFSFKFWGNLVCRY